MAADRLLGRVTKQTLGRRIPALNDPLERLADDGIVGGLHDRCEEARRQQLAGSVAFDAPLLADVSENQYAARDGALLVGDRSGAVVDRTLAAALANQQCVIR